MQRSSRTAIIALTLAITFIIVVVMSSSAIFAATSGSFGGSSSINYLNAIKKGEEQLGDLTGSSQDGSDETGLKGTVNPDGTLTLNDTALSAGDVLGDALSTSNLEKQHKNLIEKGILRYVIYDGTICQAVNEENGPMLIVILDFSRYNISKFEAGFLDGLAYVLVGSNEVNLIFAKRGAEFTETNYTTDAAGNKVKGALTIFDSTNGGIEKEDKAELILRGVYPQGTNLDKSVLKRPDGTEEFINQYSVRLILPDNQSVTLEKGSLVIQGVDMNGFSTVPPDCLALGISHWNIKPVGETEDGRIAWSKDVTLKAGVVANKQHFHWMTVSGYQMAYAFSRTLNAMLGRVPDSSELPSVGTVNEIFRKPDADSDFSQLFLSVKKVSDANITISVYDEPRGDSTNTTEEGIAAAVNMMYWLDKKYKLQEKIPAGTTVTMYHYPRSTNNEISEAAAGVLTCDINDPSKIIEINGEKCYTVECTHSTTSVIGYYSESGKLYDANKNLFV